MEYNEKMEMQNGMQMEFNEILLRVIKLPVYLTCHYDMICNVSEADR